ncbi:MAG: hypothetical protein ABL901_02450 [Hyphomicrobiaceae bacterium]
MPTIKMLFAALLLAAFLGPLAALAQAPGGDGLTSVAIDPSLFREGAIKRFSGTHEAWNYVCDEVAKMKKRFCSLRTAVKDGSGRVVAALTVSTGEDGRPAALLKMAAASFNEAGIEVSVVAEGAGAAAGAAGVTKAAAKGKSKAPAVTKVYPAACTGLVCQMVWTLPADQIAALSAGSGLQLRYTTPAPGVSSLAGALKGGAPQPVVVAVPGKGFAAAVDASVKPLQ